VWNRKIVHFVHPGGEPKVALPRYAYSLIFRPEPPAEVPTLCCAGTAEIT
jgi:hypothetical protein